MTAAGPFVGGSERVVGCDGGGVAGVVVDTVDRAVVDGCCAVVVFAAPLAPAWGRLVAVDAGGCVCGWRDRMSAAATPPPHAVSRTANRVTAAIRDRHHLGAEFGPEVVEDGAGCPWTACSEAGRSLIDCAGTGPERVEPHVRQNLLSAGLT